jgi:predicted ribosome quality control (RQC) complex YloA/Tae2 family protein
VDEWPSLQTCHHVILELYASGNLILTDHTYEIIAVLRTHT